MFDNRHGYPGKFTIYECDSCGFMQTKPQLSNNSLTKVYTNYYPKRDANIKEIFKNSKHIPSKKEIYKNGWATTCHFQTGGGQKVLDVGCGTCQSLLEIKTLDGEGWGIEVDQNSQKVAKKLNLKFHLGTIHNCKFPKKYFDLITASQVLEHEPNPKKFLKKCKQFLKSGGQIILSFPNTRSLYQKIWGKKWLHWHIPYHLNHFNNKSIKRFLKDSGLTISSIKTVTPNLWTILQIRSFLAKPRLGKRNPMWDGGQNSQKSNVGETSFKIRILNFLLSNINSLLFINRVIDNFGFGESFVIVLTEDGK